MNRVDHLAAHANRKVRIVAIEKGPHADQLFNEAAGARKEWALPEWLTILRELDGSDYTVAQWRERNLI